MNLIFVHPEFPSNFKNFCIALHKDGVNVLGLGSASYDDLDPDLREALSEYYRVDDMRDYDQMFRAVAFFSFKYGKIDWIESNADHWLDIDAKLREDFNIKSGVQGNEVLRFRSKHEMKKFYLKGEIPTARQEKLTDLAAAEKFVAEVGYPVIVKPDVGDTSRLTRKIENEKALKRFFEERPAGDFDIEQFLDGQVCSYDAILDSVGEPLFESETVWPSSLVKVMTEQLDLRYYVAAEVPEELRKLGRRTTKAFGMKSRFVHLEFIRLAEDYEGIGKKGDFAGLEVNMRPAGGYTTDMMNFAHSTDVYQIWADMIALDARVLSCPKKDGYCVYAGRRDRYSYVHSDEEIRKRYQSKILMNTRMTGMFTHLLGNQMYAARFQTKPEIDEFADFVQKKR